MRRLLLALVLAGCSAPAATTPQPVATPEFDLARVKAVWSEDCTNLHDITDEDFCSDAQISAWTANSSTLNVLTKLSANDRERGVEICNLIAVGHFDPEGVDLGYFSVAVTGEGGAYLATCTVRSPAN